MQMMNSHAHSIFNEAAVDSTRIFFEGKVKDKQLNKLGFIEKLARDDIRNLWKSDFYTLKFLYHSRSVRTLVPGGAPFTKYVPDATLSKLFYSTED